jgi:hypothetical protein
VIAGMEPHHRKTVVVYGPLAMRMRRLAAARAGELGLEVTNLPGLAARLAGGFCRPAATEDLLPAIALALAEGGFSEFGSIAGLPGTPRAVARTLADLWRSDTRLAAASRLTRIADLAAIEARVRAALPPGVVVPPDLRDAALARLDHAFRVIGAVKLDGILDVDLVWRPLIVALSRHLPLTWTTRGNIDRSWFPARVELVPAMEPKLVASDACADPRAEAVEALRWARELLARGDVPACDVAIAATSIEPYDVYLPTLAREAGLALFSTHGVPALDTRDGRTCAVLADVLLRGPTQERVRRLLRRVAVDWIPQDWSRGLPRGALLADAELWRIALENARSHRISGGAAEEVLPDLVRLLSRGPSIAAEAGERLLRGGARRLWRDALRIGPSAALELTLGGLRVADAAEPGAAISWGPAVHLAAAPRAHVRLLGLTARNWPRAVAQDPLAPAGEGYASALDQVNRDLLHYAVIAGAANGGLAVSRPRRSTDNAPLPPSRLWPAEGRPVPRGRIPLHAYSEADRLLARPADAKREPRVAAALKCWRAWHDNDLTPYDGLIAAGDSAVDRALSGILSIGALGRLLRDPLAFVLLDACGWEAFEAETAPLTIGARARGELVHELLHRAISRLTIPNQSGEDAAQAVTEAANTVFTEWPLSRAVPPGLPWRHAVDAAAASALAGLLRTRVAPGTMRWTEVPFGVVADAPDAGRPPGWNAGDPVSVGGLDVGGRIDCLDVRAAGDVARVIDWKTGEPPPDGVGLLGGLELQRVIYSSAARRVLRSGGKIRALIVHLGSEVATFGLDDEQLEHCQSALEEGVTLATRRLREGWAIPGSVAREASFDRIRLALPADLAGWLSRKASALDVASEPLRPLWAFP